MNVSEPLLVSAADVVRVYGEGEAAVRALDGITVGFPAGRFTAIMGPSGSGKSTLMHILAGLDRPTSGSVVLDGVELVDLDDKRLTNLRRDKVGFVFQSFNLLPVLDARENIVLPMSIAGRKPDEEWLNRLIDTIGLRDRLDHRPSELSGGQQQRVAMARALASRPAVIFADEPTGNLDSKSSGELLTLLRNSVDELGQTVIMVTHDAVAASYADRLLVLGDGRIVHDGQAATAGDVLDLIEGGRLGMRKVALRGLFARKLRLALTVLAVVLGTTLIAGTYVFTDSINNAFDTIFTVSNRGTDAAITPHKTIDTSNNGGTAPTVPGPVLEKVRQQPGVANAEGSIFDAGTILGKDGKRIGSGGAPNFLSSVADVPRFQGFTLKTGRRPQNADEAAIDAATADKEGWTVGDKVCAVATAPRKCYTLVGTTQIAGLSSFGGAAVLDLVLPEAQRMLGKGDGFDEIQVAAKPGVSPQQLKTQLARTLGPTVDVRTGQEQADKESKDIRDNLGFLKTFLLAFAFIALFVGAFLIFNTFSITVAQRMREFALLRTLGASRRQIWRAVVSEGLTLGFVGGVVGFLLGIGTAALLRTLFKAFGADLPSKGVVIESRTVIVTILVGTVVSLVASIAPAMRAMRVPPVEALREGVVPMQRGRGRRMAIGAGLLLAIGVGLMCVGLFGSLKSDSAAISFMGGGAALTFLGVALLSPRLVRPLANVIGAPIERATGITGQLARENSVRQPGRTAVTAAALMIGVALVTFASIFAAGAKATINGAIDKNLKSAFVVQNTDGFSPFSPEVLTSVDRVQGVSSVSGVRFSEAKVRGVSGNQSVSSIDPRTFPDLYKLDMKQGGEAAVRNLGPGDVLVKKGYADSHDTKLGDTLQVTTPNGKRIAPKVIGIVDDKGGLLANLTVTNAVAQTQFGEPKDAFGLVGADPGADLPAVKQQISKLLDARYPEAEVLTNQEFKDDIAGQVNQLLGLIYALLALAIIVSLFGIVNTLVLSISERTRELGMLRAIGTSRKQVKRMIRWEAVITALIGGVLGVIMGVVLAVLFTQPLDDFTLSIPVPSLIIVLILAGVAGVGASVLPARRAAKLDVLEALAYE